MIFAADLGGHNIYTEEVIYEGVIHESLQYGNRFAKQIHCGGD